VSRTFDFNVMSFHYHFYLMFYGKKMSTIRFFFHIRYGEDKCKVKCGGNNKVAKATRPSIRKVCAAGWPHRIDIVNRTWFRWFPAKLVVSVTNVLFHSVSSGSYSLHLAWPSLWHETMANRKKRWQLIGRFFFECAVRMFLCSTWTYYIFWCWAC
jgi:hypothetical protein